jgi:RNA polymerase sigma factor (sigma-70 family)
LESHLGSQYLKVKQVYSILSKDIYILLKNIPPKILIKNLRVYKNSFGKWKYYICRLINNTSQRLFKKISDITIIEGVRKQDEKILNWLYENYLQAVRNYVMKNSGSQEDVSDVFQDSIIVLYKQITENSLDLTSDLKGYFFGIARNVWNAQLRKKQRTTELDFDLEDTIDHEAINYDILERIISRSFQKLKPDEQRILSLFSEGLTYEEISLRMNLKNETYARRKKYLCKEALLKLIKADPEYQEYLNFLK